MKIAGIAALIALLWAGSVAFTVWDVHRRGANTGSVIAWLALVVLLPLIGFLAYLVFRVFTALFSPGKGGGDPLPKRVTAVKRPVGGELSTSTLLASDLSANTIYDPRIVERVNDNSDAASKKYLVSVISGADLGKEFIIETLPVMIGRDPGAAVRLDGNLGVSRKHAEVFEQAGHLRIRDLGSTHGTQVNGLRIEERNLDSGDRIQVGLTILVVKAIGV